MSANNRAETTSQGHKIAMQNKTLKEFVDKTSSLLAALIVFVGLAGYMITISDRILGLIAAIGASIAAVLIIREIWNEFPTTDHLDWRLVQFRRVIILTALLILIWGHLRYHNLLGNFLWGEIAVMTFSILMAKELQIQNWIRPRRKLNIFRFILVFAAIMTAILGIPLILQRLLDSIAPVSEYVQYSGLVLATLLASYCLIILAALFLGKYPFDEGQD
jgi:hypothetical protein